MDSSRISPRPARGPVDQVGDLVESVKQYARQETLEPIKGAIRWVAVGSVAALCLGMALVFATLGGIGLLVAARGFKLKRNYGRAPTVLANGIALGVSYYMFDGGRPQLGVPLATIALLTLISALLAVPAEEN